MPFSVFVQFSVNRMGIFGTAAEIVSTDCCLFVNRGMKFVARLSK